MIFSTTLTKAADKRRIVLMLDTFEQMTALEDWARDVAQRLHTNVLFVIAGRALPNWSRAWDSWHEQRTGRRTEADDRRRDARLDSALLRDDARRRARSETGRSHHHFARGLPMVVTSAVQLWVKYGVEDFQVGQSGNRRQSRGSFDGRRAERLDPRARSSSYRALVRPTDSARGDEAGRCARCL